jgi:hypothetical protein
MARRPAGPSGLRPGPTGPGAEPLCQIVFPSCTCFLPTLSFLFRDMYLYLVLLCFCLRFSDSYSTEDSDYRIADADDLRTFEAKKRKIDEVEGQSSRRTRQTGKSAGGGSSSAAAGPHLRTKTVHARGPPPSRRGKGARGPMDVEQEEEITENLGSAHINIWRKLRRVNPYRFHER